MSRAGRSAPFAAVLAIGAGVVAFALAIAPSATATDAAATDTAATDTAATDTATTDTPSGGYCTTFFPSDFPSEVPTDDPTDPVEPTDTVAPTDTLLPTDTVLPTEDTVLPTDSAVPTESAVPTDVPSGPITACAEAAGGHGVGGVATSRAAGDPLATSGGDSARNLLIAALLLIGGIGLSVLGGRRTARRHDH
ncbi:MAG: hypothetical protein QOG01_4112 [Pseudonocardiales bacterium]|nr:hypothetical protein [Pseudonocardiales bacterium]